MPLELDSAKPYTAGGGGHPGMSLANAAGGGHGCGRRRTTVPSTAHLCFVPGFPNLLREEEGCASGGGPARRGAGRRREGCDGGGGADAGLRVLAGFLVCPVGLIMRARMGRTKFTSRPQAGQTASLRGGLAGWYKNPPHLHH